MSPSLLLGAAIVASQGLGYASPYPGATAEIRFPARLEIRLTADALRARKLNQDSGYGTRAGAEAIAPAIALGIRPLLAYRYSVQRADDWKGERHSLAAGAEKRFGKAEVRATADLFASGEHSVRGFGARIEGPTDKRFLFRGEADQVFFDQDGHRNGWRVAGTALLRVR